ncbi:HAMP domain-containing protein [Rhodomicrobium sp. Az07]|uniref:ATP-binding protein n=1 Tax=Rhodomicrobium sp. Az07 TaxID=2839034 RepID=UPI001BEA104B|nr:ATP-binding protein [Rhodomicrobium sp. Az07]MBT3071684.1 HAMP domain-containing protein [Rhodomicrobium sp. Az07]
MRIFPKSLKGQLVVLAIAGLLLAQAVGYVVIIRDQQSRMMRDWLNSIFSRIETVAEIVDTTPSQYHDTILKAANSPVVQFTIDDKARARETVGDAEVEPAGARDVFGNRAKKVVVAYYDPFRAEFRLGTLARGFQRVYERLHGTSDTRSPANYPVYARVSLPLEKGTWLNVAVRPRGAPTHAPTLFVQFVIMAAIGAFGIMFIMIRVVRPLKELADAATALGRREYTAKLEEKGPTEVVETIRAFNDMQDKLCTFMQERTKMLAALSHDLRTPITSLRLRAEFIEDDEMRRKILQTLAEMFQMTESALAYAKGGELEELEESRLVDVGALVSSVCADLADMGAPVECSDTPSFSLHCRAFALKRALRNIVVNAVAYGTHARVTTKLTGSEALIVIEDDGPGIPEDDMEKVFSPFVRLENSRNADTGGMGLGLAIARGIVRFHGGDVILKNRPEGGLRVTIALPGASVIEKPSTALLEPARA